MSGLMRQKLHPYYLTLNRTEFAYGWPDTTGGGAVTSEWIHPLVLPQQSLPPSYHRVAHFLSLGAIFLFASPLVGPLSNKEQIISLLFARYRTLALPDFLFWIRFTRPSVRALYPSPPPAPASALFHLSLRFPPSLYLLETIQTLSIVALSLFALLISELYFIFSDLFSLVQTFI